MMGAMQCQSCGMPFKKGNENYGTNADGTPTQTFCDRCYLNGQYVDDLTMEEMIEKTMPLMKEAGIPKFAAKMMLNKGMPKLQRWQ